MFESIVTQSNNKVNIYKKYAENSAIHTKDNGFVWAESQKYNAQLDLESKKFFVHAKIHKFSGRGKRKVIRMKRCFCGKSFRDSICGREKIWYNKSKREKEITCEKKIKMIRGRRMKRILVTGGTVFVSKYIAEYFVKQGEQVFVLNRNQKEQISGVHLIQADRHAIGQVLQGQQFDGIIDVCAYTGEDVQQLLDSGVSFETYILISSSAVYPETTVQPFMEEAALGKNIFWGSYGTNKIAAEQLLQERVPQAYILRPPYLYGPYNNVYREGFVFDCAMADRKFYLPGDGEMRLQFFHVADLCRCIAAILEQKPDQHIFNVGNEQAVSIREWVQLCYEALGKQPAWVSVFRDIEQRAYFPFYDYEYVLDVTKQKQILPETMSLQEGLKEAAAWYTAQEDQVNKRPYLNYIDEELSKEKSSDVQAVL